MTNERIVIDGFESLTKQQAFDMAAKHVLKNGDPSINENDDGETTCTYGGIGCAAAPFLKESARARTPNKTWTSLAGDAIVPQHLTAFIGELQHAHDNAAVGGPKLRGVEFVEAFKKNMLSLADLEDLDASSLMD